MKVMKCPSCFTGFSLCSYNTTGRKFVHIFFIVFHSRCANTVKNVTFACDST